MKFGHYNAQINHGALLFNDDGVQLKARTFVQLLSMVRENRMKNGGDLASGWQHRLGSQYCEDNPECASCTEYPAEVNKMVTIGDMKTFFGVVRRWLSSNEGFVDQDLAEKRAEICSTCPQNAEISGCGTCFRLAEHVSKTLGKRSTSHDNTLYGCLSCGCNLKVKVWCPSSVIAGSLQPEMFPSHCWQLREHQSDT